MLTDCIIGRVGAEIELRYTPSGKAVAEVNLAVDDGFGENKKTAWISVTIWGQTAETAAKYVSKGDRLGISGRLIQDEWEDKQTGKKQRKTKVTCEQMTLLGDRRDHQSSAPIRPAQDAHNQAKVNGYQPQAQANDEEDDIPF